MGGVGGVACNSGRGFGVVRRAGGSQGREPPGNPPLPVADPPTATPPAPHTGQGQRPGPVSAPPRTRSPVRGDLRDGGRPAGRRRTVPCSPHAATAKLHGRARRACRRSLGRRPRAAATAGARLTALQAGARMESLSVTQAQCSPVVQPMWLFCCRGRPATWVCLASCQPTTGRSPHAPHRCGANEAPVHTRTSEGGGAAAPVSPGRRVARPWIWRRTTLTTI